MKKITMPLLTAMFLISSALVFADDSQNTPDQNATNQTPPGMPDMPKDLPKPPLIPAPPSGMGMGGARTVVATSDGGIVIVEGDKITKLDSNLEVTKSIELKDAENTGDSK